jgi:3-hydroxyisobutyrate dehydrogenase-like beta-hydroxyacid dehydrogenase
LVTGSVRNAEEKELALSIVKSHEYVEEVSDAIAATEDVRTLKDRLSFVIQSMLALKNAIAADYAVNKRFLKTSDAPVIGSTYGIFVPETYGAFSIEDDGTIKTTIRNIAD